MLLVGNNNDLIRCFHIRCYYVNRIKAWDIKDHLFIHAIDKKYEQWLWHDETELSNMSNNYQVKSFWHLNDIGLDD